MKAVASFFGGIVALGGPLLAALGAVVMLGACASCQSTVGQAPLPALAGGQMDGTAFDQQDRHLYLADTNSHGVAVVDLSSSTPQYVHTIDVTRTPSELALASAEKRLYVSLSNGSVAVIDTGASSSMYLQVIAKIAVAPTTARWLDYDAATHHLLVSAGIDGRVVAIDTRTDLIDAMYAVGLPVGQARYDRSGQVYVTVPSADAVYRIRASDGQVTRKFVLKGCHPSAMAINGNGSLALVGCRSSIGLIDLQSGATSVTRTVQGASSITYDRASDRFAAASPHDASDSSIGMFAGDGGLIGTVAAFPNSSHAVFDDARGLVYASSTVGLLSLRPSACLPPPSWLKFAGGAAVFVVPLAAAAFFLILYARRMDRTRGSKRRKPEPTFRELQKEDQEHERERMRAFEDSVLGPELNPEP